METETAPLDWPGLGPKARGGYADAVRAEVLVMCDKMLQNQNATLFEDLTGEQLAAIEALVGGASMAAAGEAAGVARCTIHRWLHDPGFAAALGQAKRAHLASIHAGLRSLAFGAVSVLDEALKSPSFGAFNRASLALKILTAAGATEPEVFDPVPVETPPANPS